MKGEGIVLLLLVAVGGYFLYQASQKPAASTTGSGLGVSQPGFGVNFGFSKFGN